MTDFSDNTMHLLELQEMLGLQGWNIRLGEWLEGDDNEDANVRYRSDERCATVRVNPKIPADQVRRLIAHELVHVLLYDLMRVALDRKSEAIMDILTDAGEVIANRLATALTGQQWQPTAKKERKWHAPFVTPAAEPEPRPVYWETAYMPEDWPLDGLPPTPAPKVTLTTRFGGTVVARDTWVPGADGEWTHDSA